VKTVSGKVVRHSLDN